MFIYFEGKICVKKVADERIPNEYKMLLKVFLL